MLKIHEAREKKINLISRLMLFTIAWRYVIGKKSTQAVQIIAWVSILAMAIGSACLIIVLSVFNGFEGFIKNLYGDYFPEAKISAIKGHTFTMDDEFISALDKNPSIAHYSKVLEEKVLILYDQNQAIASLKGVDHNYANINQVSKHVTHGVYQLDTASEIPSTVVGIGLANRLGLSEESPLPFNAYIFKDALQPGLLNPEEAYASQLFMVKGIFVLQEEIDNQMVMAPLKYVQSLTGKENQVNGIELKLKPGLSFDVVKQSINGLLYKQGLKIENRFEQNKTLYFILTSERVAVFAILTLMLFIASFNIMGSLSMMVIEKQKDIAILQTLGLTPAQVLKLFLYCGVILSLLGAGIGAVIAWVVCKAQQQFGFVSLGDAGDFLINAYPVDMRWLDFVLVMITVIGIALLASMIPARRAALRNIIHNLQAH